MIIQFKKNLLFNGIALLMALGTLPNAYADCKTATNYTDNITSFALMWLHHYYNSKEGPVFTTPDPYGGRYGSFDLMVEAWNYTPAYFQLSYKGEAKVCSGAFKERRASIRASENAIGLALASLTINDARLIKVLCVNTPWIKMKNRSNLYNPYNKEHTDMWVARAYDSVYPIDTWPSSDAIADDPLKFDIASDPHVAFVPAVITGISAHPRLGVYGMRGKPYPTLEWGARFCRGVF